MKPWPEATVYYESVESMRKHIHRSELLAHFACHDVRKWLLRAAEAEGAETIGSCAALFTEAEFNKCLTDLFMGKR